jgi:hypothetical protein
LILIVKVAHTVTVQMKSAIVMDAVSTATNCSRTVRARGEAQMLEYTILILGGIGLAVLLVSTVWGINKAIKEADDD